MRERGTDEHSGEEEPCPPLDEMVAATWIAQIGEKGLSETEATDSFVAMNEQRKRTWHRPKSSKKAARKDRGFFTSRTEARNRAGGSRLAQSSASTESDGTPKDLRARLRWENRCLRCQKKGHWQAECPEKQRSRDGTVPTAFSGLTFLHTVEEESDLPPGHLIVDITTGLALIGEAACIRWDRKLNGAGLRGVQVHTKMATPKGVGGAGRPTRSMMMPTVIDGLAGVVQYTVVTEDIPGPLPLSFQEKQGALINLGTNKLHLPRLEAVVHMHRTPGGHRTIDVTTGLTPATLRVLDGVPHHYGLTWDQFVVRSRPKKQRRRTVRQTLHAPLDQCSIAIDGRDNDHLRSTNSHFSQDVHTCETRSSSSHDDVWRPSRPG